MEIIFRGSSRQFTVGGCFEAVVDGLEAFDLAGCDLV
jgi:hypothetical protein